MHDLKYATFLLHKRPLETAANAYVQSDSDDDDVGDQHQTVSIHKFLVPMPVEF